MSNKGVGGRCSHLEDGPNNLIVKPAESICKACLVAVWLSLIVFRRTTRALQVVTYDC